MNATSLLQVLHSRIEEIATAIAPVSLQRASQARFDKKLFATHSTQLKDYLLEVRANMDKLSAVSSRQEPNKLLFWLKGWLNS